MSGDKIPLFITKKGITDFSSFYTFNGGEILSNLPTGISRRGQSSGSEPS